MRSRVVRRFGLPLLVGVSVVALMGAQCQPNKPNPPTAVDIALAGQFDIQNVFAAFADFIVGCEDPAPYGGIITSVDGEVDLLGPVRAFLSTFWDFSQTPPGNYTPTGSTTGNQATVQPGSYTSCSSPVKVTGQADLETANGTIKGEVEGGEVYETSLGADETGTEAFVVVNVTGGTGAFQGATGEYVLHTHTDNETGELLSGEIDGEVTVPA